MERRMNFKSFYLKESKSLIGYHSSNTKFDEFSHHFTGGVGFYFTPEDTYNSNDEFWNSYKKNKKYTYKCEITLDKQPDEEVAKEVSKLARGGNPRKMMVDKFLELGYDGLDQSPAQIWVFNPNKIKIIEVLENDLKEMASLNSLADEDSSESVFTEILTKNHIGYKDPDEKFNFENVLWARFGKNLFVGFDGKIHPTKAMIVVFVDFRNKWNFPLVYGIETKTKYRNKGLATKIHDYFIKKYGGFITDDSLSYSETNGGIYFVYKKLISKHPTYEITPKFKIIKKIETLPSPREMNDMDNMNMFLVSKEELGDDWNELDESVLLEASPEYPSIKMFVDKIEKTMKDFSKNRSRYEKYKQEDGYKIPLRDIVNVEKFPKDGFLDKLSEGDLFLAFGEVSFNKNPILKYQSRQKDGTAEERISHGLYIPSRKLIAIPFISEKTNIPFTGKIDQILSSLLHELTHAVQNVRGEEMKRTGNLSEKGWFDNANEREATLNQIHREIERYLSSKIKNNKSDRQEFNKSNDSSFIKEYVKVNNELVELFEDVDAFENWFDKNTWVIRYNHPVLNDKLEYLKKFYEGEWSDFILETFITLKNKFKNVIPTKLLRYGK